MPANPGDHNDGPRQSTDCRPHDPRLDRGSTRETRNPHRPGCPSKCFPTSCPQPNNNHPRDFSIGLGSSGPLDGSGTGAGTQDCNHQSGIRHSGTEPFRHPGVSKCAPRRDAERSYGWTVATPESLAVQPFEARALADNLLARVAESLRSDLDGFPVHAHPDTGIWSTAVDGSWNGGFWVALVHELVRTGGADRRAGAEWFDRLRPRLAADSSLRGLLFWYGAAHAVRRGVGSTDHQAVAL